MEPLRAARPPHGGASESADLGPVHAVLLRVLERGGDEAGEERVRVVRLGLELGMELRADEERMIRQFDDFDEAFLGRDRGNHQPGFLQAVLIVGVELVAVAVAFVDAVLLP